MNKVHIKIAILVSIVCSSTCRDITPFHSYIFQNSKPEFPLFNNTNNIPLLFHNSFGNEEPQRGYNSFGSSFENFFQSLKPQAPFNLGSNTGIVSPGCGETYQDCTKSPYRTLDGSCNNLQNPSWGTPNTRYNRLLRPNYGDGISSPTLSVTGHSLPGSRKVSVAFYPDVAIEDHEFTLNAMQYGQIITHDMSMIAGSTQAQPHETKCCSAGGALLEQNNIPEHCYAIELMTDDPLHQQTNARCMTFVRTLTDRDRRCVTSPRQPAEQLTAVNHFLDLSIVYGNDATVNQQVRQFQGGLLKTEIRNGQQWLPRSLNTSAICLGNDPNEICYLAGDARVNQNPQLTLLQIIWLREHNRVATILNKLNPHWDDETIFQEARKIAIAEHQYISYYEWLPIFIGVENSLKNNIIYDTYGYVNDYRKDVNPSILNEHATAAFRFFHSLIAGSLDLVDEERSSYGHLRLSDWLNRPGILEKENAFDHLCRGLATQPELASDQYHDSEITQFLFRDEQQFGQDLKAFDIQRNRDHGLASYNDYRQFCGLPRAETFHDFLDYISAKNVEKLANVYEHPDDVELTIGGSLERLVSGTLSGPTFLCILTEQFYRTRVGDRFWFEHSGITGFTSHELQQIKKTSISRLLCDNSETVQSMQPKGFIRISEKNAVTSCELLPAMDLSYWKEEPGIGAHFGQNGFPFNSFFNQ